MKVHPCVRCGFCCKSFPCGFGEDDESGGCVHLKEIDLLGGKVPIYACGLYDYIRTQPGWKMSPAFGQGCSSPLFNDMRERVIKAMKKHLPEV
jgi:hypothetical protein